jgi:hypothetical protein
MQHRYARLHVGTPNYSLSTFRRPCSSCCPRGPCKASRSCRRRSARSTARPGRSPCARSSTGGRAGRLHRPEPVPQPLHREPEHRSALLDVLPRLEEGTPALPRLLTAGARSGDRISSPSKATWTSRVGTVRVTARSDGHWYGSGVNFARFAVRLRFCPCVRRGAVTGTTRSRGVRPTADARARRSRTDPLARPRS